MEPLSQTLARIQRASEYRRTNFDVNDARLQGLMATQRDLEFESNKLNDAEDPNERAQEIIAFVNEHSGSDPLLDTENNRFIHEAPICCGCTQIEWDEWWEALEHELEYNSEFRDALEAWIKEMEEEEKSKQNEKQRVIRQIEKVEDDIQKQENNAVFNILNKYKLQIAIGGYYEIIVVVYGLILESVDSNYCDNIALVAVQWILLIAFFIMGIAAEIEDVFVSENDMKYGQIGVSLVINSLILLVLLLAIDIKPFDCYDDSNIFILEIVALSLGVIVFFVDVILKWKCAQEIEVDDKVQSVLDDMKSKIDQFLKDHDHDKSMGNLLYEYELKLLKNAIRKIKNSNENVLSFYFNVFYYYLQDKFGAFIALSGYYAIFTFIVNIIFKQNEPDNVQLIIRWILYGIFVIISLVLSIKKSFYVELGCCSQFMYWIKKYFWSFLMSLSLIMAVEYKPLTYYVSDQNQVSLSYANVVCLVLSILGHTYFAPIWNCLCKRKESMDVAKLLEMEIRRYEQTKSDDYEDTKELETKPIQSTITAF